MKHAINDSELVITLEKDLISTTVSECLGDVQELLESIDSIESLSLDISQVNTIDSQGLNLLVGVYQECQSRDWAFRVTGASSAHRRLFQFVKLTDRFGIPPAA